MGMLSLFGKINVEQAKYTTEQEYDGWAIRLYQKAMAITTDCGSSLDDDKNKEAFKRLAGYIGVMSSPRNERRQGEGKEKISMTAPVVNATEVLDENDTEKGEMPHPLTNSVSGDVHHMAFILPSDYTIENAPNPTDSRVHLKELPPQRKAALTFSGTCSEDTARSKAEELLKQLREANIALDHSTEEKINNKKQYYEVARYNPPWTIPFLRTNEVLIPLPMN